MVQIFYLIGINLINLFYNLGLFIVEVVLFSPKIWWWKMRSLLFLSYLSDGPYLIVRKEAKRAPVLAQNLIYGETPCLTMKSILQELGVKPSDCFVDLGCGRGLTVFFVNQYFHIPTIGVDVIPTFIRRAEILTKNLGLTQVRFIKENLSWITLDQIGKGTIFYLTGTTFEDELLAKITLRLELLPIGVRLITLSEALTSTQFKLIKVKPFYFSWGKADVYFHEKVC